MATRVILLLLLRVYGFTTLIDICDAQVCMFTNNNIQHETLCSGAIPVNVSEDTRLVVLSDFKGPVIISNTTFDGYRWDSIVSLNIICGYDNNDSFHLIVQSRGLSKLQSLEFLRFECKNVILENDVFYGLIDVRILEFTNCVNLHPMQLLSNLFDEHLVKLEVLIFRTESNTSLEFDLAGSFWNFVFKSSIRIIDVSGLNVRRFDMESFQNTANNLTSFIATGTRFKTVLVSPIHYVPSKTLHTLMSTATVVETILLKCPTFDTYMKKGIELKLDNSFVFSGATLFSVENMCNANYKLLVITGVYININFQLISMKPWNISSLLLTSNHINLMVKRIFVTNSTLRTLSLNLNNMTFLHPRSISNIPSLTYLHLSSNFLQNMNTNHGALFGRLFMNLYNLKHIFLSNNSLTNIPEHVFANNHKLELIDLADNHISLITFHIDHLDHLFFLNLQRNFILTLDSSSISRLESLFIKQLNVTRKVTIYLRGNRFVCYTCRHLTFLNWLQSRKKRFSSPQICLNKNDVTENVVNISLITCGNNNDENKSANTVFPIVLLVVSPGCLLLSTLIARYFIKRTTRNKVNDNCKNTASKEYNRNLQYIVFLSFSSEDALFIDSNVVPPLTRTLQGRVHKDIKPLCVGDTAFTLGRYIHDEIISCLEKSQVLLVLLTNSYCRSRYCVMEFQNAIQLERPVVVMTTDKVDVTLMTPMMSHHYNINTRIIWTKRNGDYVLKCSWDKICDSILKLV